MPDNTQGYVRWQRWAAPFGAAIVVCVAALVTSVAAWPKAASVTAGSTAIPASAIPRLRAMELRAARINGDSKPVWILAVSTNRAKALTVATPGDSIPHAARQTVYLIVMKGHFTFYGTEQGSGKIVGQYLSVTLDPATFQTLDLGLSNQQPPVPLNRLGRVSNLLQQR